MVENENDEEQVETTDLRKLIFPLFNELVNKNFNRNWYGLLKFTEASVDENGIASVVLVNEKGEKYLVFVDKIEEEKGGAL